MTERISLYIPRRVWKYVHRSNAHTVEQPSNPRRSVCARRVQAACYYVCANFHPFIVITDSSASSSLALVPLSHPSRAISLSIQLLVLHIPPGSSFIFHQRRRRRLRRSPPIFLGRAFSRFFSPWESIPPFSPLFLRRTETVGTATGVQRVQPSVSEAGLVSLVTAPHKGIAL